MTFLDLYFDDTIEWQEDVCFIWLGGNDLNFNYNWGFRVYDRFAHIPVFMDYMNLCNSVLRAVRLWGGRMIMMS